MTTRGSGGPRPPTLAAWAGDYLAHLEAKRYADSTVQARRRQLAAFTAWLDDRGVTAPRAVTLPVLERYRVHLFRRRKRDGSPLGTGSQVQHLLAVRGFFRWLARERVVRSNPADALELPRRPRRIPRTVLTAAEAERVLTQPDPSRPLGVRDRALLELLYSTGLRRAECAALGLTDVDLERLVVFVREGKGGRDRLVPLGQRAARWIERYVLSVRPRYLVPPDDGALFLSTRGRGLSAKRLGSIVRSHLERALGKTGSCHVFRHTMATLMLEGGADVRHIQEILGHAELSTTALYTHVSIRHLQDVHRRTHPASGPREP